jgi:hypothetical protein
MSEQMNTPMLPPPSGVAEWFSVWKDAVTKPSDQTFARIALSPNAKLTTALLWVFLAALVSSFLTALVPNPYLNQMMQNYNPGSTNLNGGAGAILVRLVCGAPIAAVIAVVFFLIGVGIIYLLAKMFGGRGTFDQLAYAFAAFQTPISLVIGVLGLLSAIPFARACFGLVSLALLLYSLALAVMAVKGVSQFGWGQAAGAVLLPVVLFCCCLSVGAFAAVNALRNNAPEIFDSFLTPPAP